MSTSSIASMCLPPGGSLFYGTIAPVMPYNSKSLANLTPWSKGQSGNPAGHVPVDKDVLEFMSTLMDEDEDYGGGTRKRAILERMFMLALGHGTNNLKACEILLNRVCGRVPLTINHVLGQGTQDEEKTIDVQPIEKPDAPQEVIAEAPKDEVGLKKESADSPEGKIKEEHRHEPIGEAMYEAEKEPWERFNSGDDQQRKNH